jgi:hypothetical protein
MKEDTKPFLVSTTEESTEISPSVETHWARLIGRDGGSCRELAWRPEPSRPHRYLVRVRRDSAGKTSRYFGSLPLLN